MLHTCLFRHIWHVDNTITAAILLLKHPRCTPGTIGMGGSRLISVCHEEISCGTLSSHLNLKYMTCCVCTLAVALVSSSPFTTDIDLPWRLLPFYLSSTLPSVACDTMMTIRHRDPMDGSVFPSHHLTRAQSRLRRQSFMTCILLPFIPYSQHPSATPACYHTVTINRACPHHYNELPTTSSCAGML